MNAETEEMVRSWLPRSAVPTIIAVVMGVACGASLGLLVLRGVDPQRHPLLATVAPACVIAAALAVVAIGYHRTVVRKLRSDNEVLEALANTDGLTGLTNRRGFDRALRDAWSRAARKGRSLSLLMIDVDRFKKYNDRYGHQQGDNCLRAVAAITKNSVRGDDKVTARYGGEEIAVLLPDSGEREAAAIAERIRTNVEATRIEHVDNTPTGVVTESIGVATLAPATADAPAQPSVLVEKADKALYRAKRGGRNQVSVST